MPDWKKLIEGKIALAKRGLAAGKVHAEDRSDFWEVRGYHNDADLFKEQRFPDD